MTAKYPFPLDEMYRRVNIITRVRYIAARRLIWHHRLSQYVITLISIVLIAIPLLQAMGVSLKSTPQVLNAAEVFLAIAVLAYSLLLGNENYVVRSERMLSCGLELSNLCRKLVPYLGQEYDRNIYEQSSQEYQTILAKYDNHDEIDFEVYEIDNPNFSRYKDKKWHEMAARWIWIKVVKKAREYSHYLVVMAVIIIAVISNFSF